jgi:hypothetical protein
MSNAIEHDASGRDFQLLKRDARLSPSHASEPPIGMHVDAQACSAPRAEGMRHRRPLAKAVGASYEDHIAVRRDGYRFGEITAIASPTLVPDETAVDCQQLEE